VLSTVYLLWFVQGNEHEEHTELLIGVYKSEQDANGAIERLRGRRGFSDSPQGFQIAPYELNKDHWTEGFVVDGA
jgi:hypothetical protein